MPDWGKLAATVAGGVLIAAAVGWGSSWLATRDARIDTNLRLLAIEKQLGEALNREAFKEQGAMEARVAAIERALAEDRHGPLWRAIREIREGR